MLLFFFTFDTIYFVKMYGNYKKQKHKNKYTKKGMREKWQKREAHLVKEEKVKILAKAKN